MEQQFIAITEKAPRLTMLEEGLAREFLAEYDSYENRVEDCSNVVPMRRCLEKADLMELLDATEGLWELAKVTVKASGEGSVASALAAEESESDEEDSEEEEEKEKAYVKLSNEHVTAMLISYLGPSDVVASGELFEALKMKKDKEPFSARSSATQYLRDWKTTERWCALQLPNEKFLVKRFVWGIYPNRFAKNIDMLCVKKLHICKKTFMLMFNRNYNARVTLKGAGGMEESKAPSGPLVTGKSVTAAVPSKIAATVSSPSATSKANTNGSSAYVQKGTPTKVGEKVCFHCHQPGHIRPDCPLRTPNAAATDKTRASVKLGVMKTKSQIEAEDRAPVLMVDISVSEDIETSMQMKLKVDTGAEINLVGDAWVTMLTSLGATSVQDGNGIEVGWVNDSTFQVTSTMTLHVVLTGTNMVRDIKFWVAPKHIALDTLVLGWKEIKEWALLTQLERVLATQKSNGVLVGVSDGDGNQKFTDVDGNVVNTDDLLWPDNLNGNTEGRQKYPHIGTNLTTEEKAAVCAVVDQYIHVFSDELVPGGAKVEPMTIKMSPEWNAEKLQPMRRYAPAVEAAMQYELEAQVKLGIVEPSQAKSGAPVHMVRKEESETGFRFCIDFKQVNQFVEVEPYPLPTIQVILDSVGGSKYFAKFDLKSGYWQFPVERSDRHKLAFQVQTQVWQYAVVPMGHKKSSFHVQRQMNTIFSKVIGKGVYIYLDDIFMHAITFDAFLDILRVVLSLLHEHSLRCKPSKCEIGVSEITVLGHVVSAEGTKMSDERVAAVDAMPFPRSAKELRRYLGCVNYMRRHVVDAAILMKPLSAQVNVPVSEWPVEEMQSAFVATQQAVRDQLHLGHLDYGQTIVVSADASILGVGGCLGNRYMDEDGEVINRVVACASHAFTEAEAKWKTIEQEAFALIYLILYFRTVLWGQPFVLETDHRNLTYIHGGTSPKVMRWSMVMQNFSYALVHTEGVSMFIPDAMSRAPRALATPELEAVDWSDFNSSSSSPAALGVLRVVAEVSKRRVIFDSCHNSTQGHHGVQRTVNEIRGLDYEWPRMTRDVAGWIAECPSCQKVRAREPDISAVPSAIGSFCIFEEMSVDFVGPLPVDEVGNSYILNIVCSTTRYCELFAVEAATAVIAAHCLLAVVSRYGCFRRMRSDRGSHFVNEVIEEFLELFEIQAVLTLAQRPQAKPLWRGMEEK